MNNKTCGNCRYFDSVGQCNHVAEFNSVHASDIACCLIEPKKPTNGDVIRQGGDKALTEISIYEDYLADGVKVYRSTLIKEKYWLTRACAISYVEQTLATPAESEGKDE